MSSDKPDKAMLEKAGHQCLHLWLNKLLTKWVKSARVEAH